MSWRAQAGRWTPAGYGGVGEQRRGIGRSVHAKQCGRQYVVKACLRDGRGRRHGLQNVFHQAARYAKSQQLDVCHKILLADGGRFYLYRRPPQGDWQEQPSGYLNVLKIREDHLLPRGTNAVDTLIALTPARIAE
jgi:hypothetical protein